MVPRASQLRGGMQDANKEKKFTQQEFRKKVVFEEIVILEEVIHQPREKRLVEKIIQ
jgi:hypothetical protein